MDIRKVKKLIELLEESDIDELEIKEGEESVRISRHSSRRYSKAVNSTGRLDTLTVWARVSMLTGPLHSRGLAQPPARRRRAFSRASSSSMWNGLTT